MPPHFSNWLLNTKWATIGELVIVLVAIIAFRWIGTIWVTVLESTQEYKATSFNDNP